jgi:hypothetical protein
MRRVSVLGAIKTRSLREDRIFYEHDTGRCAPERRSYNARNNGCSGEDAPEEAEDVRNNTLFRRALRLAST